MSIAALPVWHAWPHYCSLLLLRRGIRPCTHEQAGHRRFSVLALRACAIGSAPRRSKFGGWLKPFAFCGLAAKPGASLELGSAFRSSASCRCAVVVARRASSDQTRL